MTHVVHIKTNAYFYPEFPFKKRNRISFLYLYTDKIDELDVFRYWTLFLLDECKTIQVSGWPDNAYDSGLDGEYTRETELKNGKPFWKSDNSQSGIAIEYGDTSWTISLNGLKVSLSSQTDIHEPYDDNLTWTYESGDTTWQPWKEPSFQCIKWCE